ncbi:unnamed protein product, partial [Prorocentrum cordatum]
GPARGAPLWDARGSSGGRRQGGSARRGQRELQAMGGNYEGDARGAVAAERAGPVQLPVRRRQRARLLRR